VDAADQHGSVTVQLLLPSRRLRKLNNKALTQLAIDLAAIKEALGRFPADAFAAALPGTDPSTVRGPLLAFVSHGKWTPPC
jgi:hypothetical protein